jgi:hypothetical protein
LGTGGFKSFKQLKTLDISETSFREALFPRDLFEGLNELSAIYTSNYRLCCDDVLTMRKKPLCFFHERTLSSCGNLLRSSAYQITMAALSVVAVAGNAACLLLRHVWYVEHAVHSPLSCLLTHLNVANLLTGVYCAMVAVADNKFRMTYASQEVAWRQSNACTAAGVLTVLSHTVSALLMLVLTLHRLLLLLSPSTVALTQHWAVAATVLTWCVGLVVATVPLLPYASQWRFYSNTALCVPLPSSFSHSGSSYHFALEGAFHTVVLVLVAAGQTIMIYKSKIGVSFLNTQSSLTREEDARVTDMHEGVLKMSVLYCVRGAVLSCVSLVTYLNGVALEENVAAALAIFLLNLNAVLNPCVYVVNHVRADRRWETQRRMLQLLRLRTAQHERMRRH